VDQPKVSREGAASSSTNILGPAVHGPEVKNPRPRQGKLKNAWRPFSPSGTTSIIDSLDHMYGTTGRVIQGEEKDRFPRYRGKAQENRSEKGTEDDGRPRSRR